MPARIRQNPFNPIKVSNTDLAKVQVLIREAFGSLKTGVAQVVSSDGTVDVDTSAGVVDLSVPVVSQDAGSAAIELGNVAPDGITTTTPTKFIAVTIGAQTYLMPAWPWSPPSALTPPLTGLTLWCRGDAGITQAGGTVSLWQDQSGNGNDLAQASGPDQPNYNATGFAAGIPSVDFSTTDSIEMENSGFAWGTEWTVTVVFQLIALGTSGRLVDWFYPTANREIGTGSGTPFFSDSGSTNVNGNPIAANTTCRLVVTLGSGTVSIYSDDLTTPVNSTALTESATNGIRLGSLPGTGQASNCRVSEVFVHDHALDSGELGVMAAYLTSRGY